MGWRTNRASLSVLSTFLDDVERWKAVARAQMLGETKQRARAGRVKIEVSFGVFLFGAAAGLRFGSAGPLLTVVGLLSVVLGHELTRALVFRGLRRSSKVCISLRSAETALVGAPSPAGASPWVDVAGSVFNLSMALGLFALLRNGVGGEAADWLRELAVAHAGWGVLQFVPLLPFRGGRSLAERLSPARRVVLGSASVAFALAATVLANRAQHGALAPLLMYALVGAAAAFASAARDDADERSEARALADLAERRLRAGDSRVAAGLAETGLSVARSRDVRDRLWRTLAWAAIGKGDILRVHEAIARLPARAVEYQLFAAYLTCCNRLEEAEQLLWEARQLGLFDPEATKLLIELLYRRDDVPALLRLARTDQELLSPYDWLRLEAVVPNAWRRSHEHAPPGQLHADARSTQGDPAGTF